MNPEYSVTSPSLGGFLTHESLKYDGIRKPIEILRALDGPAPKAKPGAGEEKVLEQYFYDLYGVFMKRLSQFVLAVETAEADTVKLQAMLQEMIRIKRILNPR